MMSPQELKQKIDLRDLVSECWGTGKQSGKATLFQARWRDGDRHASFAVYADGYKDFGGQGESGDVFGFLQNEFNLTFIEAVEWLRHYVGDRSNRSPKIVTKSQQKIVTTGYEPPSAEWQQAARLAIAEAQNQLWQSPDVLDYLRNIRGLSDETIKRFKLGYNPDWRKLDYINPTTGKTIWLAPGITIPVEADGALWAVRIRCRVGNLATHLNIPDDRKHNGQPLPKYLNLSGSRLNGALFNGDVLNHSDKILIVEGEFDAMLAGQHLPDVGVVTLGSATGTLSNRWHKRLLKVDHIAVTLDNDATGKQASEKLSELLNAQAFRIPDGKDISDYVMQGGNLSAWYREQSAPWWTDGIPDSWRSAILTYCPPRIMGVLEAINEGLRRYLLPEDGFSVTDLQAIAEHLPQFQFARRTLYDAIKIMDGLFVQKVESQLTTDKQVSNSCTTSARGARQATAYRLLSRRQMRDNLLAWALPRLVEKYHPTDERAVLARIDADMLESLGFVANDQLSEQLNDTLTDAYEAQHFAEQFASIRVERAFQALKATLSVANSTPLPAGWALGRASDYRAAFLHAVMQNDDEQTFSRNEIASTLGIANGTIARTVKRAGLQAEAQFELMQVSSVLSLERDVNQFGREIRGYPVGVLVYDTNNTCDEYGYDRDYSPAQIESWLIAGKRVEIRFQTANKYHIVSEEPVELPAEASRPLEIEPVSDESAPKKRAFYGRSYDPYWLEAQLCLALKLLGWQMITEGRLMNPQTGEIVYTQGDSARIIDLLVNDAYVNIKNSLRERV